MGLIQINDKIINGQNYNTAYTYNMEYKINVIYLGDRDELSQDYTSDLHRQNVTGV